MSARNFNHALRVLALLAVAVPNTFAAAKNVAGTQVTKLSLQGNQPKDMELQSLDGHSYLYLFNDGQASTIVDVTKPNKPKVVKAIASERAGRVADAAMSTGMSMNAAAGGEMFLWDISRPGSPQLVHRFAGVVREIEGPDGDLFILDSEGVWTVTAPKPAEQPSGFDYSTFG